MKIYHSEFNIEEGFELAKHPKSACIELSPGHKLYEQAYLSTGKIKCWCCGLEADRWIVEKHKNDLVGRPVLNPYAIKSGVLVMMNRDHIIPRSLGGLNVLENLRVSCEDCNSERANRITKDDKTFILDNLHLFSMDSFRVNKEKMEAMIERNQYPRKIKAKIRKPFQEVEKLLKI